jgi:hypothetical protein
MDPWVVQASYLKNIFEIDCEILAFGRHLWNWALIFLFLSPRAPRSWICLWPQTSELTGANVNSKLRILDLIHSASKNKKVIWRIGPQTECETSDSEVTGTDDNIKHILPFWWQLRSQCWWRC